MTNKQRRKWEEKHEATKNNLRGKEQAGGQGGWAGGGVRGRGRQYLTSGLRHAPKNQTKVGNLVLEASTDPLKNLTGTLIGSWVRPYKKDELIDVLLTELDLPNTQTSLSKKVAGLGLRVGDV